MKPRNILISVAAVTTLIFTTETLSRAQLSGNWTNKANLLKQGRSLGVAVLNGKIYLAGGYCGSLCDLATLDEYNPVTDAWTNRANMQTRRYAPAAAALNGKLYVLGGYVSEGGYPYQILPTVEAYDPTTDTWTNKASMTRARFAHGAVTLNGTIYAIGGNSTADGAALASVEQYDPVSDTWTNKADLPTPRVSFAAAVVNGNIYVVGGVIGNTAVAGVYIYNSTSDTWSIGANIPTPRATLAAVVVNGQILAMGGSIPGVGGTSRVEQYDPAYNVWSSELDMPTSSRNECYAAVIGNTVYVFGGYDNYTMQSVGVQPVLKIFTAIELEFFTETNKVYVLQASPDLVTWTNFDVFLGNGDFWRKLYSTRGQSRLFYRVLPSQ